MVVYKFPTSTGTERALLSALFPGDQCFPARKREWRVRSLLLYGVKLKGPNAGPLFFWPDSPAICLLSH